MQCIFMNCLEYFDFYFCVFLTAYCWSLFPGSETETGYQAVSPAKFSNFVRKSLSRLATRSATHLPSLLHQISSFFILVVSWSCTIKFSSSHILLPGLSENFSPVLYPSNDNSSFWKKCAFWLTRVNSIKKILISNVGSLLRSYFELKQIPYWLKNHLN